MRLAPWLAVVALTPLASAQLQAGDLLQNRHHPYDGLFHFRPSTGALIHSFLPAGSAQWEGAGVLENGNWVTTRRFPPFGLIIYDPRNQTKVLDVDTPGFDFGAGDVGVRPDGTILIVDIMGPSVRRYDQTGTLLNDWTIPGNTQPFGLFVDSDGSFWTTDVYVARIFRTAADGTPLGSFPVPLSMGDLVRAPDGTLWMVERGINGTVHNYTTGGSLLGSFDTFVTANTSIAMAPDGTLWVSGQDQNEIFHYETDGTYLGSIKGTTKGSLFITIVERGAVGTNYCGPAPFNSSGSWASITAMGSLDVSAGDLDLWATGLPVNEWGYFLNSPVQGFTQNPGGSAGNLCLGGAIGRHSAQIGNSGATGDLKIELDLDALPRPGGSHTISPGETWYFQCWFRDGATSNFTDGVCATFE